MSKWKWIVAGRRAVLAVRRLLRREVASWRPAESENCRRQIPMPAPCKGRKTSLLDNFQLGRGEFDNYLTKRVLSPIDGANLGLLCDGFGEFSLSSGRSRERGLRRHTERLSAAPRGPLGSAPIRHG